MNTEERLVSYQVNECLKQRDHWRSEAANWKDQLNEALTELERLRGDGWDQAAREGDRKQLAILSAELEQERQTSGTLYKDWLKAQAEVERLRAVKGRWTINVCPRCNKLLSTWPPDEECRCEPAAIGHASDHLRVEVVPAAMPTLTPEQAEHIEVYCMKHTHCVQCAAIRAKLALIASGENDG